MSRLLPTLREISLKTKQQKLSDHDLQTKALTAMISNYFEICRLKVKSWQLYFDWFWREKFKIFCWISFRWYWLLFVICQVLLPINSPLEYWGDSVPAALFVAFSFRYLVTLNIAWLVNSAHFIWALNSNFKPSDSNSIFIITKTYWPQYHYLLPCDYQTGEFGDYGKFPLFIMQCIHHLLYNLWLQAQILQQYG